MRVLRRLDWFRQTEPQPLDSAAAAATGLTREALEEAIHCLTPDDRVYRGVRCLRWVGMRVPLLAPLALTLWIPGVTWLADRVYGWVSRNRRRLSRQTGCSADCPPVRDEMKAEGRRAKKGG